MLASALPTNDNKRYDITADAKDAAGTVILTGAAYADVYVGEVTYVEISLEYTFGNLDIALTFPEQDLLCNLELDGIILDSSEPIKVTSGPGILIQRLVGGPGTYTPGSAESKMFSVIANGNNAVALKQWADTGDGTPKYGSLIVNDLLGAENYRWNLLAILPLRYELITREETEFRFSVEDGYRIPSLRTNIPPNYNEDTDQGVEINGVTLELMQAFVREDPDNNTLTLMFDYESGLRELYTWTAIIAGYIGTSNPADEIKDMSVITWGAGGVGDEVGRRNYYKVFPIRFEQIDGFSTDIKAKYRVVLSFDSAADA